MFLGFFGLVIFVVPLFASESESLLPTFAALEDGDIVASMRLLRAKENLLKVPIGIKECVHLKTINKASYKIENLVFQDCVLLDHRAASVVLNLKIMILYNGQKAAFKHGKVQQVI